MGIIQKARNLIVQARDAPAGKRIQKNMDSTALVGAILGGLGEASMKNSEAICSAVTRMANALASMPCHLYNNYMIQKDDPLEMLMAFAPNANQTPHGFKYAMMACLGIYGRAYALLVPDGRGGIGSIDVLDPLRVQTLRNSETREIWYGITLDSGEQAFVHTSSMIAVLWGSTDGVGYISPLEVLGATLKYDRAIKEISLRQLQGVNGAVVLTYPSALGDEKKTALENRFINAYAKSTGQVLVLEGGVTADRIAGSVVDPQVLNSDNITKSKVASVYNMHPRMIGANVANDYSTSEQVNQEFASQTMLPWVVAFEEQFNRKLLMWSRYAKGDRFRFSMDELIRGDSATMAEKHSKEIRSGKKTPNEARAEDYMPPLPYGDELMSARDLIPLRVAVQTPELLLSGKQQAEGGEKK